MSNPTPPVLCAVCGTLRRADGLCPHCDGNRVEAAGPDAGRCRSCGAPIYWLRHISSERPAPITVAVFADGNIAIAGGFYRIIPPRERAGRDDLHKNHFANCPQAAQHARVGV